MAKKTMVAGFKISLESPPDWDRMAQLTSKNGRSLPCYLQSFILSFHGWRQAISCLLNLMGATFAQVGPRDTQPTPPDLLLA